MSNDPEQEYFSDGMAEEILNSLSHLKDLKVAGYCFNSGLAIMKDVKQAAETAIKLDDTLGETYCALATYCLMEWDWGGAKKNYRKAIELNPKYTQAHSLFGMLYLAFIEGNFEEAENQGLIAIRQEPFSAIDQADLAWSLLIAHKFDEAIAFAQTGIELDSNSFLSHRIAGLCYITLKHYEKAIATFKNLISFSNRNQLAVTGVIWAYCSNGNFDEARVLMNELEQRAKKEYIAKTQLGLSAAYLGI